MLTFDERLTTHSSRSLKRWLSEVDTEGGSIPLYRAEELNDFKVIWTGMFK